ncbi:MAG: YbhB/YbcL family Raf kinase inhibitor-like protein [Myxococcales bacterium]|nr:YbhB/YbcL family Raf kinase inhibitor-like protein [Myxococcales bacterium]
MSMKCFAGASAIALAMGLWACAEETPDLGPMQPAAPTNDMQMMMQPVSAAPATDPMPTNMTDPANMVGNSEPPSSGPAPTTGMETEGPMPMGMETAGMDPMPMGMETEGMDPMSMGMETAGMGAEGMDPMEMGMETDPAAMGSLGGPLMYTGEFTAMEGAIIVDKYKCPRPLIGGTGENTSPPLEWSGGPADTQSFGLVLYDSGYSMLHWVVWDIPATATSLPEGIQPGYELAEPAGAHQAQAGSMVDKHAYYGPCSTGGVAASAKYEFRLYALNVASLELTEGSSASEAQAAIEAAALESVVWTGNTE